MRKTRNILPVIFGNEIEAYSFARLFHETAGLKSLVIAPFARGPINDSRILETRIVGRQALKDPEKTLAIFDSLSREFPDKFLIALINSDEGVELIAGNRDRIASRWALPYAPLAAVHTANSKPQMARVFSELGLHVPQIRTLELSRPGTWIAELTEMIFPVVLKPADGTDLEGNFASGLAKVEPFTDPDALIRKLGELHTAGVRVPVIVQQLIPGDDTTQWVVNGYIDALGEATAAGSGRVLLGLHSPNYLGNAGLILTDTAGRLVEDGIRVAQKVGLRGFFSFDVKIDPRDGKEYWLDLNPRAGRGHYYLKVGGVNLARAVLDDMFNVRGNRQRITQEKIFAIIPSQLANETYIRDPELLARIETIQQEGGVVDPLDYPADRNMKRLAYRAIHGAREIKTMRTYYPEPTDTGF